MARGGRISIQNSPQASRILAGLPGATINVVVPLGTLLPTLGTLLPTVPGTARLPGVDSATGTQEEGSPIEPGDQQETPGAGEVLGKYSHFLTGSQVRELALQPGSTLFRILTDPATGRYVERSTTAYRFDKAMRTHITYADLTCRAPGCTVAAAQCEIDHVQEHGTPGGETSEANGAPLDHPDHQDKTEKLWDAIIHANRDITWTSLLGRIYRTKAHDYHQYDKLLTTATEAIDQADPEDREAAIDQAIYTALSYRPPGQALETEDDYYEADTYPGWDLITLTHTDGTTGRRRYRPDPQVAAAEADRMHQTGPDLPAEEQDAEQSDSGEQPTGEQGTGEQGTGEQGTGEQSTGEQSPGEQSPGESDTGGRRTGRRATPPDRPGRRKDGPTRPAGGTTPWDQEQGEPPPF